MVQIRKMRESETKKVLELWNENCLDATNRTLSDDEAEAINSALRQYASHGDAFCLAAEKDNKLVSFLTARITMHPILEGIAGEIEELYVQPNVRHKGIGTALVSQAVYLLREKGASTIRVHACVDSKTARDFWQSLGWENDLATFSLYKSG
jgi:ribosomal protein S18 acetylase RimI-like enzyme